MKPLHTVLGAGGAIGTPLAKYLNEQNCRVRLASRNPKPVTGKEELTPTDVLDSSAVRAACAGSEVVYLTVGLHYSTKVWQTQWPVVMQNTIVGCQESGAKLVFFDNVYAYGLVNVVMTEETPHNPCSRKGEIRARVAETLLDEINKGFRALIARAPDFYGPRAVNTFFEMMITRRIQKGQTAQWLCSLDLPHSLIFTPDAAKATGMLGLSDKAFGQVWHLPTAAPSLTGREYIRLAAKHAGKPDKAAALGRTPLAIVGLFIEAVRESKEMLYQFEHPYHFDSTKFAREFGVSATPYEEGIRTIMQDK